MATLSVQTIARAGLSPSYGAAAGGGDVFANDDSERTFLHVKNGGGGSITVTVAAAPAVKVPGAGNLTPPAFSVAVPSGEERMIGPFPSAYNNASGQIAATYSGVSSVTVAAVKCAAESK